MSNSQTDDPMTKQAPGEVPKPEPGEPISPGQSDLGKNQKFEATARFTEEEASKTNPQDGLKEVAGFPEAQVQREKIYQKNREKRYTLGGKVTKWIDGKLCEAFGEKNVRTADGLAEVIPGYSGIRDSTQGSIHFQEALHNPHLSAGEKAIAMGKAWGLETWGKAQILLDILTLGSSSFIEGLLKMTGKKILFKAGKALAELGKNDQLHKKAPEVAETVEAMADWNQETDAKHPKVTDWFGEQIDALKAKVMPPTPETAPAGA